MRKPGFYWVFDDWDGLWRVAEWFAYDTKEGEWLLPGEDGPVLQRITEVDERRIERVER